MTISLKRQEELKLLKNNIDCSDIPELTNDELKKMSNNHLYKPLKKQISIRIDADVLQILQSEGKGYQARINKILRQALMK